MKGEERREKLFNILKTAGIPVKGGELSASLNVSRQVIVQDIALLRAEGRDIIATPQGYILLKNGSSSVKKIIAVKHSEDELEDELKTIVEMGGRIVDVTIEHKVYGEITGKLMISSIHDIDEFLKRLQDTKPLLYLTGGVHLHTIEGDNEKILDRVIDSLKSKGYLIQREG